MVQICLKLADPKSACPEWVMVELQGDLMTKSEAASLSDKDMGDLFYTKKGVPGMIIGHHILYGKVVEMEKPYLAMTKVHIEAGNHGEDEVSMETDQSEMQTEYRVHAVIQKKLVFKTRPKPIIANVPKKI